VLQVDVSCVEPWQTSLELEAVRDLAFFPVLHVVEHWDHSDQSDHPQEGCGIPHSLVAQGRLIEDDPEQVPLRGCFRIARCRVLLPLQLWVHSVHDDHSPQTHEPAVQFSLRQRCSSERVVGQAFPLPIAFWRIARVRFCLPRPQVGGPVPVQVDHSLQSSTTQSSPQLSVLHDCVALPSVILHSLPPFTPGILTDRALLCVPPPQVTEQAVQPVQSPHLQSTGVLSLVAGDLTESA